MGMDVYGKKATAEVGEYFRRNVWGWRPLWAYVENCHPEIASLVEHGNSNSGDGLNARKSKLLATEIRNNLADGTAQTYITARNLYLSELPKTTCELCEGTGIRTDAVGLEYGMPERELAPEVAIITGRTQGFCNGCSGEGTKEAWETNYYLDQEDLEQFADFLENCGGFEIC
jgi:hypothetical protein